MHFPYKLYKKSTYMRILVISISWRITQNPSPTQTTRTFYSPITTNCRLHSMSEAQLPKHQVKCVVCFLGASHINKHTFCFSTGESMASLLRRALISRVRGLTATGPTLSLVRSAGSLPEELQKVLNYSEMYPDLLPDPDITRRNYVAESLERADMLKRSVTAS